LIPVKLGAALLQTSVPASTLNSIRKGLHVSGAGPISPPMELRDSISIRVNGEPRRVSGGATIVEMLGELGLDPKKVAVERNLDIVPRSSLAEVTVVDGDAFEIVHFVGGG
jgi:sulfur carrier protein